MLELCNNNLFFSVRTESRKELERASKPKYMFERNSPLFVEGP